MYYARLRIYRHSEFKIVKRIIRNKAQIHAFPSHIKVQKYHAKMDEKYHKCYNKLLIF